MVGLGNGLYPYFRTKVGMSSKPDIFAHLSSFCQAQATIRNTSINTLTSTRAVLRKPYSNPECEELHVYRLDRTHAGLDGCHNFHIMCQSSLAKRK